ncbi:MAG: DegV family protein [Polyangiaceae bacterium]
MQIVTNPGSNLPAKAIEYYGITISPQQIVVDGKTHDTRRPIALDQVDIWVKTAREFPHVVGTTALEFTQIFSQLAKDDREIIAVMTSRKVIQSYAAAISAARTLMERPQFANAKIAVLDSTFTDLAAGLIALAAGEAKLASAPFARVVPSLEAMAAHGRFVMTLTTLENMVKGGRAGFLRAWLADFLNIKPILGMLDGEIKSIGKMSASGDRCKAIVDDLVQVGRGRRVWAAIAHGNAPDDAAKLADQLRATFDVAYLISAPLSPSIYLYAGPRSLCAAVMPIDKLAWEPPTPGPDFSLG